MKYLTALIVLTISIYSPQAIAQTIFYDSIREVSRKIGFNDYKAARKALEFATKEAETDDQRASCSLMSGMIDMAEGKLSLARKSFLAIAENEKNSSSIRVQGYTYLGSTYRAEGKYQEERDVYLRIAKLPEGDDHFYGMQWGIASSFSSEGKPQLARLELEKVISSKKSDSYIISSTYLFITDTYIDEKNYEAARATLEKILLIDEPLASSPLLDGVRDNKQRAVIAIGVSYSLAKDFVLAKESFAKVLTMKGLTEENRKEANAQIAALEKTKREVTPPQENPK